MLFESHFKDSFAQQFVVGCHVGTCCQFVGLYCPVPRGQPILFVCEASARMAKSSAGVAFLTARSNLPPSSRATEIGPWVTRPSPKAVRRPRGFPSSGEPSRFQFFQSDWREITERKVTCKNSKIRSMEMDGAAGSAADPPHNYQANDLSVSNYFRLFILMKRGTRSND